MNFDFHRFASLDAIPGLRHLITTRSGGIGAGPYASLNLGYHVGDDPAQVTRDRELLAQAAGYRAASLVAAQQVHGAGVRVVGAAESGRGALDWDGALPSTDALVVGEPGVPVAILVADCAPVLLVDPVHRVLAVAHAGWRGALAGVAGAALRAMSESFATHPCEVLAGIGPCLCVPCLEVGEEVAEQAAAVCPSAVRLGQSKPHLDLRALTRHDLETAGVPPGNIEVLPDCPRCLPEIYFSHRGQGGVAGRFGLVAWWD